MRTVNHFGKISPEKFSTAQAPKGQGEPSGDVVELVELLGLGVVQYLVNIEKARTPFLLACELGGNLVQPGCDCHSAPFCLTVFVLSNSIK